MRKPSTDKGDARILFSRIKHVAQTQPHRSAKFKTWLRLNHREGDFHHVFGSVHGLKSTDLLAVIVPHKTHIEGEDSIDWLVSQVPQAVQNLIRYCVHLEGENEAITKLLATKQSEIDDFKDAAEDRAFEEDFKD